MNPDIKVTGEVGEKPVLTVDGYDCEIIISGHTDIKHSLILSAIARSANHAYEVGFLSGAQSVQYDMRRLLAIPEVR